MGKRFVLVAALMAALSPLAGCAGTTVINSYLLDDASVGGDPARTLKPVKGVLVWPLENIATGTKSKGVETRFSGIFADTVTLHGSFERVVVLEEDQAKDLMARAGEELGLKKKPKAPGDGALIATKLGQLTGTEVILTGRIEDYDEDKVDKATITVVQASFNVLDAREKAYATLDSFSPVKRIWRTNAKRVSKEGPFNSRESIDEAFRTMLQDVVERMSVNLGYGANVSDKALKTKAAELNDAAEKSFDAGDYDKAIAGWNEVLKIQPNNKKAKKRIEAAEKAKLEAAEKAKAAALRKQIDEIKGEGRGGGQGRQSRRRDRRVEEDSRPRQGQQGSHEEHRGTSKSRSPTARRKRPRRPRRRLQPTRRPRKRLTKKKAAEAP